MTDELVHGVDFKLLRPFRAFGLSKGTSDRVFVELADLAIVLVELFLAVCDFVLQGLHDVADVPLRLPETFFVCWAYFVKCRVGCLTLGLVGRLVWKTDRRWGEERWWGRGDPPARVPQPCCESRDRLTANITSTDRMRYGYGNPRKGNYRLVYESGAILRFGGGRRQILIFHRYYSNR